MYTPGPWKSEQTTRENLWVVYCKTGPLALVSGDISPLGKKDPAEGTNKENARLMAAAPALLEICLEAIDLVSDEKLWLKMNEVISRAT